jgi:23S rRNA (cytidine1920-2'-O)/16S rRNA (cytidine1409-2'-O)-methyltransferase
VRLARRRLDIELVEQGYFRTRDDAMRAVLAGDVSGAGERYTAPGMQVKPGCELHVRNAKPYVSRGGLKLAGALDAFGMDVDGLSCIDIGCSTGGFTDCLLKRGAAAVTSVDVGYAQFDWSLRNDSRVTLLERTNIVDVPGEGMFDLAVCDVSFTSVETIIDAVARLLGPEGAFLTLVKPQFEAPREDVGEGGVVRDPAVRRAAVERVAHAFETAGITPLRLCASPITGHKGNREYLLLGRKGTEPAGFSADCIDYN